MAQRYDEGLQVAPDQPGLEVNDTRTTEKIPLSPNETAPPAVPEKNGPKGYSEAPQAYGHGNGDPAKGGYYGQDAPPYSDNKGTTATAFAGTPPDRTRENRICGLKRRTFWAILAAAILIVIAAVVGGAVGATQANKSDSTSNSGSAAAETSRAAASGGSKSHSGSASVTATQTDKQISTTTLLSSAEATYLSDCPSANGTLFKVKKSGTTYNYRVLCGSAILNVNDPDAAVTNNQNSLNDCIKQCALTVPRGQSCNAVCWRQQTNTIDDANVGSCFGYETANKSGTFQGDLSGNSYCDGAVFIGTGEGWADAV